MGLFSGLIGAAGGGAYGYFNGPRGQGDIGSAMKYGLIGGLGGYAAPHLIKAGKGVYGAGRNYVNKEIAIAKGGNKVLASNQAPAAAAPAAEQYTARRSAKNIMQNKVRRYKEAGRNLKHQRKMLKANEALNDFRDSFYEHNHGVSAQEVMSYWGGPFGSGIVPKPPIRGLSEEAQFFPASERFNKTVNALKRDIAERKQKKLTRGIFGSPNMFGA